MAGDPPCDPPARMRDVVEVSKELSLKARRYKRPEYGCRDVAVERLSQNISK